MGCVRHQLVGMMRASRPRAGQLVMKAPFRGNRDGHPDLVEIARWGYVAAVGTSRCSTSTEQPASGAVAVVAGQRGGDHVDDADPDGGGGQRPRRRSGALLVPDG